ncbi:phosphotransferase [Streptomyces aureus]|uniref:phosphotransferase n=1 Tax=Streptomyces aureus TaxID=193461 RepID=UPI0031D3D17F
MPQTRPGGFDTVELWAVLARACRKAGLESGGASLIRGQTNAVFRLGLHPVLVKIARRGTPVADVRRTVVLVRWLAESGIPVAPLHVLSEQPVVVEGHAVTFWTYLDQPSDPVPAEALAKPLHVLHHLPHPPLELPLLAPIAAIRRSIELADMLPGAVRGELRERAQELADRVFGVRYAFPEAVLHADPQQGNALHDEGSVVLCDWDSARRGQPEWDLVTVEVHCRRFGYGEAHYRAFAEVYGWDVRSWPGYAALRDLRELRMITTNARKASFQPDTLPEVLRRIRLLRTGDTDGAWSIL